MNLLAQRRYANEMPFPTVFKEKNNSYDENLVIIDLRFV